jgi:hypothetical protein
MRKRDRVLLENLIVFVAETGKLDDGAKVEALKQTWVHPPRSPKRAVAIVDAKLRDRDVREAFLNIFELGEFTILDAISKHVEHIKGQPYCVRIKDGSGKEKLVTLRKPGSWPALKAYFDMVLPRPERDT